MKKKSLLDSLGNLLKRDFKTVLSNVPILKRRIDILCLKDEEIVGIEIKSKFSDIPEAISECLHYNKGIDKIFIALPENEIKDLDQIKMLKDVGIGLISFSENGYKIVLDSKKSEPEKSIKKSILKKIDSLKIIPRAVERFKALGHSTRFQTYLLLYETGEIKLKDLVAECGESYPLLLKHIKVLEDAGLLESRKIGKETVLKLKSYPVEIGSITKNKILNLLEKNKEGLTADKASKKLGIHRITASKYLDILEIEGKVERNDKIFKVRMIE